MRPPRQWKDLPKKWYFWECAAGCSAKQTTDHNVPHTVFHYCPKMGGVATPLVLIGTKCKIEVRVREDYEGRDAPYLQRDEKGRPIMSVVTTRDEGQDCAVLAPTATLDLRRKFL